MQLEDWSKIAWLLFMFSDLPRLLFRGGFVLKNLPKLFFQQGFRLSDLFSTAHRHENQSCTRIVFQALLQNLGYILCMMVFLVVFHAVIFAFLLFSYIVILAIRISIQIKQKNAYVTSKSGHNINDFLIKPLRMIVLLVAVWCFNQPIWLLGFGVLFAKWVLTIPHDRIFDVPNLYHVVVVLFSAVLLCVLYPYDIGMVKPDVLIPFFSTITTVYATFVGLIAIFFSIILQDKNTEIEYYRYFSGGMIISFTSASMVIIFGLLGLIIVPSDQLNLSTVYIFCMSNHFNWMRYLLFSLVYALSLLGLMSTVLIGYIMIFKTSNLLVPYWGVAHKRKK
jgi:hypothetical protein